VTSVVLLVLANLLPVFGVLLLGWDVAAILVLYWIENGIVGALNVPKILLARGPLSVAMPGLAQVEGAALNVSLPRATPLVLAPFFLVHYGMFWLGHGIFVFTFPLIWGGTRSLESDLPFPFGSVLWLGELPPEIAIAAAGLGLSHLLSFRLNYIGLGEYLRVSPYEQMFRPYGRLVVLHVSIVIGGIAVSALGQPLGLLLVLVGAKTILDARFQIREHQRAQGRAMPTSPADWLRT